MTCIRRRRADIFNSPLSQCTFDNLGGLKNARVPAGSAEQHRSAVLQIVFSGRIEWLVRATTGEPLKNDKRFCGAVYWTGSHGKFLAGPSAPKTNKRGALGPAFSSQ